MQVDDLCLKTQADFEQLVPLDLDNRSHEFLA